MKPAKYSSCALAYGFSLCIALAQSPTLLTPGTSTESVETISTGTRTTFSLTGNTILSWEQLNLAEGSELIYDFQSGDRVLNLLSGSKRHTIAGTVTSNGIVGFFSPNANFDIKGSITAKGVVLATLNTDADDFFSGNSYSLNGDAAKTLMVSGNVTATDGDVVLSGSRIYIKGSSKVEASDSVLIGGGTDMRISKGGERKLEITSDDGSVINLGVIQAPQIETASGRTISNGGVIDAGSGKVFIDVGEGMEITNDSTGVILADSVFSSEVIRAGIVIIPNEGDSAAGLSSGTLNMPMLKRPDGSVVSEKRAVRTSVPVSASGDGGRDTASSSRKSGASKNSSKEFADARGAVANRQEKVSLLKRSSFFGVRGGQ
ncbi:MAG: hypothetical protein ACSHX9_05960 [Luteolibacter sp.]